MGKNGCRNFYINSVVERENVFKKDYNERNEKQKKLT